MNKTISILGMGYVGLPTAILFARSGIQVYGYDVNRQVIDTLKSGQIHIVEPDLQDDFEEVLNIGKLKPTYNIIKSDVYIISVPTPFKKERKGKIADLSHVKVASKEIGQVLKKGDLVILESTVPPDTTRMMTNILEEESGLKRADFFTAHCPERVLPGKILYELEHNDRIIGSETEKGRELAKKVYGTIVKSGNIYTTDDRTAEMCKLVENTYRDVNIAFANELSIISDELGIDVFELINLANKHPRVNILNPVAGVGGHCLAVDPWFIVEKAPNISTIIKNSRLMNDHKPQWIVNKVEKILKQDKKKIVGVLGLAYKPNIDDLRESPSLEIVQEFIDRGYNVIACEPNIKEATVMGTKNCSIKEIVDKADFLILTSAHKEFVDNTELLRSKTIYDCVGIL